VLQQLETESEKPARSVVAGIGNTFRCDDAAGILAVRLLSQQEWDTDHLLILEAGQAPENCTGELRAFAPDVVIFVDAAEMGEQPGTVRWIPEECIDGMSASTHSLSLSMLVHYLTLELSCKVMILGIQVRANDLGEIVSPEVLKAVDEVVSGLCELLGN